MTILERDLEKIKSARAALSPEERNVVAVVSNSNVEPGGKEKVFATEAEGGRRLIVLDGRFFDASQPRTAIQIITVFWSWETIPQERAKLQAIRQFRKNFDVQALRAMIGQ
jgi:hypothetical protein